MLFQARKGSGSRLKREVHRSAGLAPTTGPPWQRLHQTDTGVDSRDTRRSQAQQGTGDWPDCRLRDHRPRVSRGRRSDRQIPSLTMAWLSVITAVCSLSAGMYFFKILPSPWSWISSAAFIGLAGYAAWTARRRRKDHAIARLKGLSWTREDFCRGWLITGDTGSGKTRSGINQLLYQVFAHDPNWGGLCIDDKGVYWETLRDMARHFNRANDLILLQVRPDDPPED